MHSRCLVNQGLGRSVANRRHISSIRDFDGGRTLRWFGVFLACAAFWVLVLWAGLRFI